MMNITAWMNMPSPYQSRFFAALSEQANVRVRLVYAYGISQDRAALGWKRVDDAATYEVIMLRSPRWLHCLWLAWTRRHDFQIVNSLWAVPVFMPVRFLHVFVGRSPLFIHSEASSPARPGMLVRARTRIRNAIGRLAASTRRFGVLAISPMAERQYRDLGFDSDRVYSFGYFNASPVESVTPSGPGGKRLVFVGQLIPRKGWSVLFEALRDLWAEFPDLTLDVLGAGPDEDQMRQYCGAVSGARVTFVGPLESSLVSPFLAARDLLVLPSFFDGWGLVVNEALMAGVPAVVSTACGAASLIENGVNGYTVSPGSPSELRRVLREFLSLGPSARRQLSAGALSSARGISLGVVSAYVVSCFRHAAGIVPVKPVAPWLVSRMEQH